MQIFPAPEQYPNCPVEVQQVPTGPIVAQVPPNCTLDVGDVVPMPTLPLNELFPAPDTFKVPPIVVLPLLLGDFFLMWHSVVNLRSSTESFENAIIEFKSSKLFLNVYMYHGRIKNLDRSNIPVC